MSSGCRSLAFVAVTALIANGQALAAQDEPMVIVLRIDNYANVPPDILKAAKKETSRIYSDAGVRIVWAGDRVEEPLTTTREIRVLLLGPQMSERKAKGDRIADGVLGVANQSIARAYVFTDRVMRYSVRWGSPSLVLGRVIAHETGHLLLAERGHSRRGIMTANLNVFAIGADQFTEHQRAAIQAGLSVGQ